MRARSEAGGSTFIPLFIVLARGACVRVCGVAFFFFYSHGIDREQPPLLVALLLRSDTDLAAFRRRRRVSL